MKELINHISDFWALIVLIAGGVGGFLKWRNDRKEKEMKSVEMYYEQLEKFKKMLIAKVAKEVQDENEKAEKDKIINGLRLRCPDCYNDFMREYEQ